MRTQIKTPLKSNAGASMVEVMIYMVLGLIVIGYALNSMTTISKGYVRGRTVMKMQKDGRDAVQVMSREIGNTGYKFYIDTITAEVNRFIDDGAGGGAYQEQEVTHYLTRPSRIRQSYITNEDIKDHSSYDPIAKSGGTVQRHYLDADTNWLNATYCGEFNFAGQSDVDSAASFTFVNGTPFDELTIYKAIPQGTNELREIHSVRYFVGGVAPNIDTLFREELIATSTLLDGTYSDLADAAANIWPTTPTSTMAILDNITSMQFMFSENGRDWVADPTGKRHRMKMIKVQLLVNSNRTMDQSISVPHTLGKELPVGDPGVTINEPDTLYRLYEKIVEIPNNGIVPDAFGVLK